MDRIRIYLYIAIEITTQNIDIALFGFVSQYKNKIIKSKFANNIKILNTYDAINNLINKSYLNITVVWNKLYKKKLFDSVYYEVGMINEDENIIHEILYKCEKVILIDKYLYHYRMRIIE